jgi:hypothetical protein
MYVIVSHAAHSTACACSASVADGDRRVRGARLRRPLPGRSGSEYADGEIDAALYERGQRLRGERLGAEVQGRHRLQLFPDPDEDLLVLADCTGTTATFYVFDARTSVDARGRLTIPAREFVREHDVRTVLGVGGTVRGGMLFTMILFARQHVTRSVADRLVPVAADFASLVQDAVSGGRLFEPATRS